LSAAKYAGPRDPGFRSLNPGYTHLFCSSEKDMDGRDEPGHDEKARRNPRAAI
jgi:hypothetical protein